MVHYGAAAAVMSPVLIYLSIEPETRDDAERLGQALRRLIAADPALHARTLPEDGHVVLGGTSESHLEIVIDRLRREFRVDASVGRPHVAYKETFTRAADGERKFATHSGDRGHYAHVKIHLMPGLPGNGYVFKNDIVAGTIPDRFIKPIEEAIGNALARGVLAGYPMEDVRVELYDGSYHDVDSSETAFRIAAALAFQDAASRAEPVVLEPVMRVEVEVPDEHLTDVSNNLADRRGQIQSPVWTGDSYIIRARVPLSQMFGYAADLRARTLGRGTCSIEFDRYEPRPPNDLQDPDDPKVRSPLRPVRPQGGSSIGLPEPDPESAEDGR